VKTSDIYWALVRHEFKAKGSSGRRSSLQIGRKWKCIYGAAVLFLVLCAMTYFALDHSLELLNIWFVSIGFPYMLFFRGYGMLKREWENETSGWWLTLPYSRFLLVGAKWAGAWLRAMIYLIALYIFAALFASFIVLFIGSYTLGELGDFLISGLNWFVLIVGFSPFILAIGFLTGAVAQSQWRPITPLLWVIFMGGGGLLFSNLAPVLKQLSGEYKVTWFPFSWELSIALLASLPLAYFLIRLSAYLLDRKLV